MKHTLIAAAAVTLAMAVPASAQMANGTGKTGAAMQTENSKPMAEGSMAMSGDAGMTHKTMAMKSKKSKSNMMMGDKPMADGMMKSDTMKH